MDFKIEEDFDGLDECIQNFDVNREKITNILEKNDYCKNIYPFVLQKDLPCLRQDKYIFQGLKVLKKMFKKLDCEDKSTHFAIRYDLQINRNNLSSFTLHKAKTMNQGYFICKPYIKSMIREQTLASKEMWIIISSGQNYTYIFTTNEFFLPTNIEKDPDIFLVTDIVIGFTDRIVKLSICQIN